MPWRCRLNAARPAHPEPGDLWYASWMIAPERRAFCARELLSFEYLRDWIRSRPPLMVCLPNGQDFCIDGQAREPRVVPIVHGGWCVSGLPPVISVSPLVRCFDYAGYIQDGIMGDDIDGHFFPGGMDDPEEEDKT